MSHGKIGPVRFVKSGDVMQQLPRPDWAKPYLGDAAQREEWAQYRVHGWVHSLLMHLFYDRVPRFQNGWVMMGDMLFLDEAPVLMTDEDWQNLREMWS